MSNQQLSNQSNDTQSLEVSKEVIESLVLNGDLSQMNSVQRVAFYEGLCKSLGLNHLTQPFEIITLKGKVKMYAKKDATDQLRKIYGVSITSLEKKHISDIYMVTANGVDRAGRTDSSIGAVSIAHLAGEALANAIMKAETKAKRRLTLSICGLGMLDELEIESIPKSETSEYQQEPDNVITSDVVDPADKNAVNEIEKMLNFILTDSRVPESDFGGESKQDFVNDFRSKLMSGTLPMEYAHNVYSRMNEYASK